MKIVATVIGVVAVCLYLLGYLQKRRKQIILFNVSSRILYILQYVLLGAFEGAVLDVAGTITSLLAQKKSTAFIAKHLKLFIVAASVLIIAAGLFVYEDWISVLPIIGVLLHTGAFWLSNEKVIRIVSFIGSPFWLLYNFLSGAYPSCVGDILSMVSLAISMFRYDFHKKKTDVS